MGAKRCCCAPLAGQGCCAALPTSHRCQRRKRIFFPLLAAPGEVHYCVLGVLVLQGYCEECSKQNFQHQDARNRIQGWEHLPRVDVTAAPFSGDGPAVPPSWASSTLCNQGDKGGSPCRARLHKTPPGCSQKFPSPSGKGRMDLNSRSGLWGCVCVSRFP